MTQDATKEQSPIGNFTEVDGRPPGEETNPNVRATIYMQVVPDQSGNDTMSLGLETTPEIPNAVMRDPAQRDKVQGVEAVVAAHLVYAYAANVLGGTEVEWLLARIQMLGKQAEEEARKRGGGLLVPKKPGLILPE